MKSFKATGKRPRSSSSLAIALLVVTLGCATCPCCVQAGTVVKIPASKDATLFSRFRDYCNYVKPPVCTPDLYAYCPWCNHGKDASIQVQDYFMGSEGVVGFTLKKISGTNIKSCTVLFPKPAAPMPQTSAAEMRLTDVSFNWNERQVTYSTKPKPTKVGSYGRFNPFLGKPVDVTKGCKYAFQNRTASGNGLALGLQLDITGVADANFFINFKSRETGFPAILTITYV